MGCTNNDKEGFNGFDDKWMTEDGFPEEDTSRNLDIHIENRLEGFAG